MIQRGMVTLHPVGLPHGPQPAALASLMDGRRPDVWQEVGIMADLVNPASISDVALGLSRTDYMASWAGYTTDPRFAYRPQRLAEARAAAERLAGARDQLRPAGGERGDG